MRILVLFSLSNVSTTRRSSAAIFDHVPLRLLRPVDVYCVMCLCGTLSFIGDRSMEGKIGGEYDEIQYQVIPCQMSKSCDSRLSILLKLLIYVGLLDTKVTCTIC